MAAVTIVPVKLTRNVASEYTYTAATSATDGFIIPFAVKDDKAMLLITSIEAADAKTLTLKAGNGFQGGNDLVITVAAGATMAITVDSGFFKQVSGEGKDNIIAIPSTLKVKCMLVHAG